MMLGAEGAWVGSAFPASHEAGILDFQKEAIVAAAEILKDIVFGSEQALKRSSNLG